MLRGPDANSALYEITSASCWRSKRARAEAPALNQRADLFRRLLLERPLLSAIRRKIAVCWSTRSTAPTKFEAFLLELLSDFVTIPEFGTMRFPVPRVVPDTPTPRTELSDALRRRSITISIFRRRSRAVILLNRQPNLAQFRLQIARMVGMLHARKN